MTARRTLGGAGRTLALMAVAAAAAAAAPTTGPTTAPSTRPAGPLGQADAAYAALTSAQLDGTITAHFDVAGQVRDHTAKFASTFAAPNRFRHEVVGDTLVCSTGTHVFATLTASAEYVTGDAPKARAAAADWPAGAAGLLASQNPSLLLAIVPSAAKQLTEGTSASADLPPTAIDGADCPTVRLDTESAGQSVTLAFDPATHLLRRAVYDLSGAFKKHGAADVNAATVTVDYTTVKTGEPVEAERFAYAPAPNLILASAGPVGQGDEAGDDDAGPGKQLVGKAAPAFTLEGLDGKKVSLADQKGKVVVLDMWATWCGPCVASLPHLDQLAKGYRDSGAAVAVFAVNLQEDADTVQPFVKKKGWTLAVLLDSDGAVAKAYKANAIPETVVVGKDGKVANVFVGSGNEDKIKAAVEAAMKK